MYELHTPPDFTHYRDPVLVEDLRRRYLVNTLAITEPPDFKVTSPPPDTEIRSDIDLVVHARLEDVQRMAEKEGMELKDSLQIVEQFKKFITRHYRLENL